MHPFVYTGKTRMLKAKTNMQEILPDIIIRAKAGDLKAFEEIYHTYSRVVYTLAYRVSGNHESAEEITQDVFIKVHQKLRTFEFRSSFKTWLYRVSMNTALNVVKKNSKESYQRVDFDMVLETHIGQENTDEQAIQQDTHQIVQEMLNTLNPDQRACIVLRDIQGMDYREIAQTLSLNLNTVRTRLKRARAALLALGQRRGRNEL